MIMYAGIKWIESLTTGDVHEGALLAGHPKIGRTRVEDHLEGLWGIA